MVKFRNPVLNQADTRHLVDVSSMSTHCQNIALMVKLFWVYVYQPAPFKSYMG